MERFSVRISIIRCAGGVGSMQVNADPLLFRVLHSTNSISVHSMFSSVHRVVSVDIFGGSGVRCRYLLSFLQESQFPLRRNHAGLHG